MGLDIYLYKGEEELKLPSQKHPKHMFKIGYFRSSYNDGGINSYLVRMGLPTLYEIFLPGSDYEFTPDWENSLKRCKEVIAKYKETNTTFDVMCISVNTHFTCESENDALKTFLGETKEKPELAGCSYSSNKGWFGLDGLNCRAFISGKDILNRPAIYVVYDKEETTWYLDALEIVQETIEWVLLQPDKKEYILHWSG